MYFADAAAVLDGYRISSDGFLIADVRFARTGIQTYAGTEMDRPDLPMVSIFRDVGEVFSAAAMRSFAGRPITLGHPAEPVTSANWKSHAIGRMGEEIRRDGHFVRGTLIVQDASAIDLVKSGTRDLSAGYECAVEWVAGTGPDGARYDASQRTIRGNHVAIVDRGRAGAACRIGGAAQRPVVT